MHPAWIGRAPRAQSKYISLVSQAATRRRSIVS